MVKKFLLFFLLSGNLDAMRNPFIIPNTEEKVALPGLKLTGIVKSGDRYAGILDDDKLATVVFKGMKVNDYYIHDIGDSFIIISHKGVIHKLFI